jgi:hypothetical protein
MKDAVVGVLISCPSWGNECEGKMLSAVKLQPCHSQLTYASNIPNAVCAETPEDEQVMLEYVEASESKKN